MTELGGAPVQVGDVLAGKYRVDRVLGVGGMGVVVAAHHLQLDDRVAIKFLLAETLDNQEAVARFAREARAAVKIKSEHVARVTDVGNLENGAPYMVMEYLEGGDLSSWVEKRGALPVKQAVDFLLEACEAIAEAHALGIVHRDLKPANLFVAELPGGAKSVKVLDFGISKLTGLSASGAGSSATKTSALMGSPLYMSPEQMQSSKDVDARGDIWALGVILYELVAGTSPFVADTMPELILKIMSSPAPALATHRADLPPGLDGVILRCLEKDRARRFQTVGELAGALVPFGSEGARRSVDRISQVLQAAGMATPALVASGDRPPAGVAAASTAASFGGTVPGPRRGVSLPLIVGATVVALGVGAVVLRGALARDPDPGPVAPAQAPAAIAVPAPAPSPAAAPVAPPEAPPPVPAAVPAAPAASAEPAPAAAATPGPSRPARAGAQRAPAPAAPTRTAPPAPAEKKPSAASLIDDRR